MDEFQKYVSFEEKIETCKKYYKDSSNEKLGMLSGTCKFMF